MAARKSKKDSNEPIREPLPAMSPEEWENRLIALSYDAVEQRIKNGTATSAELVHFLRAGSIRQREEMDKLKEENALLRARTKSIEGEENKAGAYKEVIDALRSYRSESTDDYPENPYIY